MNNTQKPISELLEFCIINVDKPAGLTSFKVCEKVRNMIGAKKAGHFGTLDPMVTGVLPVALNRACRLSNYFMIKNKEYVGKMQLHSEVSEEKLKEEMDKFLGKIMQKPPVRSRVKRVFRERNVNKFKIIKKHGRIVEFESDVQAGTYIRKLISDLGEKIGGAHMAELRRIRAGIFLEKESHKLEEIEEAFKEYKKGKEEKLRKLLIPAEIIKQLITSVQIKEESVKELLNGKPLFIKDIKGDLPNSELISVFNKEKFIGIYKIANSSAENNSMIGKPEFVLNLFTISK
ncbi:MAG: RNA-guided pseudouridylation complex pseudouridine synthase subunit Cbf5 [Candidatus Nanoarchaeia archaeon]|nr:RNA-guided pseudouridylation complex pseudouridine synthase subunit Cbf5 [Candidatus Nanoarchaeia archaeon]